MPAKIGASIGFNLPLYLMTNLHRTAEAFFTFWVLSFSCLMAMSMFFRCIGSMGRTHDQIMVPIGLVIMLCIIYAGFIVPVPYMKPWLSWFRWLDPVAFAFESLVINEVSTLGLGCHIHTKRSSFKTDDSNAPGSYLQVQCTVRYRKR